MKLVTFVQSTTKEARLGVLTEDEECVIDVQGAQICRHKSTEPAFVSMQSLIESGPDGLDCLRTLIAVPEVENIYPLNEEIRLLAPLPVPIQIRDCLCFEDHLINAIDGRNRCTGAVRSAAQQRRIDLFRARPFWYKANRFAVTGTDTDVQWPSYSTFMDYELEMAAVIWRRGVDIPHEGARSHIFGFTVFNDFSARDTQDDEMATLGPSKSKDFDGANVFGPCIVTADEFDPSSARMVSMLNGVIQNEGNSSTMHYSFEDLVTFISQSETLYPGEILGSGTVGKGCGLELGVSLQSGDLVELEIEGIGTIRNRVITKENI